MMDTDILINNRMPFCPGCGYNASVRSLSKALEKAGYYPKDIVIVSDIGCSGLIDPLFATHTIHGLHGRSVALGLGVSIGLGNDEKKVITIQGDGGATIGLQHILEAARRNVNMTHLVLNNLVYGMTGGQMSGLSPASFKKLKNSPDFTQSFDVCKLAYHAGASFVARTNDPKDFEDTLIEAINTRGFSLVELPSMCQPYGIKKLSQLTEYTGPDYRKTRKREPFKGAIRNTSSLFENSVPDIKYNNLIQSRLGILIAGSAGGGVQLAAKLLTLAATLSGLETSMKGEYPITVGTGFSVAEIIISKKEINYTGLDHPDVMIILSNDGLNRVKKRIRKQTIVILDSSVKDADFNSDKVIVQDFSRNSDKKNTALLGVAYWLDAFGSLKLDALITAAGTHKYGDDLVRIIKDVREPHMV